MKTIDLNPSFLEIAQSWIAANPGAAMFAGAVLLLVATAPGGFFRG